MSLKENFNQAFRELLNNGGLVGSDLQKKAKSNSDLDSYLATPRINPDQGAPGPKRKSSAEDSTSGPAVQDRSPSDSLKRFSLHHGTSLDKGSAYPDLQDDEFDDDFKSEEETTIISKNTLVVGNIRSFANVTIEGNVQGKVDAMKDVAIQGMVVGDLICNNADMQGSSVQGNVLSKGSVYIDNDSILLGDLGAYYASIDGKVKGNMEIGGKVEFHENAIFVGDINANAISVADGANIKGYIRTSYLAEHDDTTFPNQVIIEQDMLEDKNTDNE